MPSMTTTQRDAFLRGRRYGILTTHGVDGVPVPIPLWFEWDGRRVRYAVTAQCERLHLTGDSETVTVTVRPRFDIADSGGAAGGFAAPMPGVVIEVRVTPGDHVTAGRTLVVMEGMKMEHHVSAPCDGTVTQVLVASGDQVENGSPLLVFEPHEQTRDG